MRKYAKHIGIGLSAATMLALILDSRTAMLAATEGIELCIKTVIPSLFPMMILSSLMTQQFSRISTPLFRPIEKLCGIPYGAGGIYLAGLVGGYPIGAKCTSEAYRNKLLTLEEADRMLGFCSNPGPSFLFGICAPLFSSTNAVWLLWIIQIVSSLITGCLLRNRSHRTVIMESAETRSVTQIVAEGTKAMGMICSWVVLFRILIQFCKTWLLWMLPVSAQVFLSGLLELTNGCCMLAQILNEPLRFILCSVLLSFGGLCVVMQTVSVTKGLHPAAYLKGKVTQSLISLLLSIALAGVLYPSQATSNLRLYLIGLILSILFLILSKLGIAFPRNMLYNAGRNQKKRLHHAVS